MVFWQPVHMNMINGNGEHCQIVAVLRNLIVKNISIGNDEVSRLNFIPFIVHYVISGAVSDKQEFQKIRVLVENAGMLAESDSNVAGRQKPWCCAFLER